MASRRGCVVRGRRSSGPITSLSSSTTSAASSACATEILAWTPTSPPRCLLEIPNEFDEPAVDHRRIGAISVRGRRCRDILRDHVDEGRERLDLAAGPESHPLVAATAAENDRSPQSGSRSIGPFGGTLCSALEAHVGMRYRRCTTPFPNRRSSRSSRSPRLPLGSAGLPPPMITGQT
jgi:hypothetical protein